MNNKVEIKLDKSDLPDTASALRTTIEIAKNTMISPKKEKWISLLQSILDQLTEQL